MSGAAHASRSPVELINVQDGWELQSQPPGAVASPDALSAGAGWLPARVPGTVAESLGHRLESPGDFDASDWWYRKRFDLTPAAGSRYVLEFAGLATLCTAWLNGEQILDSTSMFVGHRVDVTGTLRAHNELVLQFASLQEACKAKRPRPRWKTALVEQQNLRWFRTTLLGRIAGWTPPVTAVGPWRAIRLERRECFLPAGLELNASLTGSDGHVSVRGTVQVLPGQSVREARLRIGEASFPLALSDTPDQVVLSAECTLHGPEPWWPHTHGVPRLHDWVIELKGEADWLELARGRIGFRRIGLDMAPGPALRINDRAVFCRGACWTTGDMLSLRSEGAHLRRLLTLARDAGVNMLRVGGTMVYESDEFYELCDELGILVWQDFMFANMDYPHDDPAFASAVDAELAYQLDRLRPHACLAVYCGNSEVAQQAAMLGRPAAEWNSPLFGTMIPRALAARHPGVPYFPSTPWGGALPFHVNTGLAHYYGVGAYRRPLSDVKQAGVRFTPECLGFSNVPERETIELIHRGAVLPPHHPRWKARVPRDSGPGWDFEDVRDHYLQQLFGVDPVALRSVDVARYLAVSRVVSGEVLQRVFAEWRAPENPCAGGLVWFYQDLWPGAGWGVVDSTARPKAAYWYLKRAWARRTVRFTDEGMNGLNVVVINETGEALTGTIELRLLQHSRQLAASGSTSVDVAPFSSTVVQADALLGHFTDMSNAYRFGPPKYDVIAVQLTGPDGGEPIGEDHFFPAGYNLPVRADASVVAEAQWQADGQIILTLRSNVFLHAVRVGGTDFDCSDNYFNMLPDQDKHLFLKPRDPSSNRFKASIGALNLAEEVTVRANR